MGVETSIALGVGGALLGAYGQNQANNQNAQAQARAFAAQQQQQQMIQQYVNSNMVAGGNPYSNIMMQMLGLPQVQMNTGQVPQMPQFQQPGAGGGISLPQVMNQMSAPGGGGATAFSNSRISPMSVGEGADVSIQVGGGAPGTVGGAPGGFNPAMPGFQFGSPAPGVQQLTQPGFMTPGFLNPAMMGAAPQVSVGGSPGFNFGQDAIMQMLRAAPGMQSDQVVDNTLRNTITGNTAFNTSPMFAALGAQDQAALDQQVAALKGGYGSFGQRLGTAAMGQEARLRSNFIAGTQARNAGIAQQSYEAAQQRALEAAGLRLGNLQAAGQLGLGGYNSQIGAAQALMGGGLDFSRLGLQAGQANQQAALATGQANQQAFNSVGLSNIQNQMAAAAQNAQLQQMWNQMMLSGVGQANAMQQSQQGQNISLMSLLAGMPVGQAPIAQPSPWGGAVTDIGTLMLMRQMFGGGGGGGGGYLNSTGRGIGG